MSIQLKTILLLVCSNVFMTFAWYAHLRNLHTKAIWVAVFASWGLAFFEYLFQVPANRIGFANGTFSLAQLKIVQEIITLSIFIPFSILYMHQEVDWNYLWAGFCIIGAAFFIFR